MVVTRTAQSDGLEIESITLSGKVLNSRPVRAFGNLRTWIAGTGSSFVQEDDTQRAGAPILGQPAARHHGLHQSAVCAGDLDYAQKRLRCR